MSEIIAGGAFMFSDPNTPTRVGEFVENAEDILNIPNPRIGMQVYVIREERNYTITKLKDKVINGVTVSNAAVAEYKDKGLSAEDKQLLENSVDGNDISFYGDKDEVMMEYSQNSGNVATAYIPAATSTEAGVMSASDKQKVDNIEKYVSSEVTKIIEGTDPNTIDSIKDLVEWVEQHGDDAAQMVEAIEENATQISNLSSEIGMNSITLLQGGIDSDGKQNQSGYFLRTELFTTFKLEVNDGYTIGQIAQYDLDGGFVNLYNDYTQPIEGVKWSSTSVVAASKEHKWIAVVFKGNSPTTIISPRENIVKSFISGLFYYMNGSENDSQSAAQQAKSITDRIIVQLPNEEDLTLVDGKMQIANRYYRDGLGYVILRRDKSFKEQIEGLNNTIIEIRYIHNLNGEEVELPKNCVLKFVGGSLYNGFIKCDASASVSADMYQVFNNISFNGVLGTSKALPEWFGAIGNGIADDTEAIQKCLDVFGVCYIAPKIYKVSKTITLPYKGKMQGEGTLVSNGGFVVIDLAFGSVLSGITIKEEVAYMPIRLDVTQLNRTWNKYIEGKKWEEIVAAITIENITLIASNAIKNGLPDNRNGSKAICLRADGSYIDDKPTKGFSYLKVDNVSIQGGYEYGVHLDVTDLGARPEGKNKTDYITDCVFKSIHCNGYVRKGFFIGGGISYVYHQVPTRIIIDGCTTQYISYADSTLSLNEWQEKTFFDYFVKINTGDNIQIVNCRAWDVPIVFNYTENGEIKEAEFKTFRVNPNTTVNIVVKDTLLYFKDKIHYEDANGIEVIPNGDRSIIANTLRTNTGCSMYDSLNVLIPLRTGEKLTAKDLYALPSGIYRTEASYNYGLFMGLPQPEMNHRGGTCYIDHFEGSSVLKFIPDTYIANTTVDGIYANTITCCYAILSRKDVDRKVDWIAMQRTLSTYTSLSEFKKLRVNNTLGLIDGKLINSHYVSGEPVDLMGFTWTENAPKTLPTNLTARDVGKMVFFNGKPVWWNGSEWVEALSAEDKNKIIKLSGEISTIELGLSGSYNTTIESTAKGIYKYRIPNLKAGIKYDISLHLYSALGTTIYWNVQSNGDVIVTQRSIAAGETEAVYTYIPEVDVNNVDVEVQLYSDATIPKFDISVVSSTSLLDDVTSLSENIASLSEDINGVNVGWDTKEYDGAIVSSGKWGKVTDSNYTHIVVSVVAGKTLKIKRTAGSIDAYAGFLRSLNVVEGVMADYSTEVGYNGKLSIGGLEREFICPSDAKYFVINRKYGASNTPTEFIITLDDKTPVVKGISNKYDARLRSSFHSGLFVAYSSLGLAPINTEEHFLTAVRLGFNAIKTDVAVTSDNVLICCHDDGFTFDSDGRIVAYDSSNNTPIHDLTWEEISSMEYVDKASQLGHYARVCTLEKYLKICLEFGVIPYITIRGTDTKPMYSDVTVPKTIELLKKYNLLYSAIINKYDTSRVISQQIRDTDSDVCICYTVMKELTMAEVNFVNSLGNACIAIHFNYNANSQDAVDYAKALGIPIMAHTVKNGEEYQQAINKGLLAGQVNSPLLPYSKKTIGLQINVEDGVLQSTRLSRFDGVKYEADVTFDSETLTATIKDISIVGSERPFADGVMPFWMNVLPYTLDVKSNRGYSASKKQEIWWEKSESAIKVKMAANADLAYITIDV